MATPPSQKLTPEERAALRARLDALPSLEELERLQAEMLKNLAEIIAIGKRLLKKSSDPDASSRQ